MIAVPKEICVGERRAALFSHEGHGRGPYIRMGTPPRRRHAMGGHTIGGSGVIFAIVNHCNYFINNLLHCLIFRDSAFHT